MARRAAGRFGGKSGSKSFASQGDAPSSGAGDVTTGWVTLLTGLAVSGFLMWKNHAGYLPFHEYNLLNITFVLWVPLIIGMLFLRREPTDLGFTVGDIKQGWLWAIGLFVLFCPVIFFVAPQPDPQRYYLGWMWSSGAVQNIFRNGNNVYVGGRIAWDGLAYHEFIMGFYMFAWEWYHRGFLLNGLRKIMPLWGAIGLQALLFMALHWGKPLAETLSSLPGGILMALLALRCRSFLPCFLLHWLISAGFDFAVLYFHFK